MAKDCNKKKWGCGGIEHNSRCTVYEGVLPEWSEYKEDEKCPSLHDTTAELYSEIDKLKTELDFSDIESCCIEIETDPETGTPTPKTVTSSIIKYTEEVLCKDECESMCDINISGYGLDFKCLQDPCGAPINKLSQLLQIIIDKVCPDEE